MKDRLTVKECIGIIDEVAKDELEAFPYLEIKDDCGLRHSDRKIIGQDIINLKYASYMLTRVLVEELYD